MNALYLRYVKVNASGSGSERNHIIKVEPPASVKHVGLELFINRGRQFEFVINPTEMKPLGDVLKPPPKQ